MWLIGLLIFCILIFLWLVITMIMETIISDEDNEGYEENPNKEHK